MIFNKHNFIPREVNGEENIIEISQEDCVNNFVPNAIPVQGLSLNNLAVACNFLV